MTFNLSTVGVLTAGFVVIVAVARWDLLPLYRRWRVRREIKSITREQTLKVIAGGRR